MRRAAVGRYDAIVVGGGHNGLTAAAYLAKAGRRVCVLERRDVLGGAAVTEEIVPGFRFSRASYLLSLLRPIIINELKLKEHGLKYHIRNPSSFTPLRGDRRSLLLGHDQCSNRQQIAQFSKNDAQNYEKYEEELRRIVCGMEGLMDQTPFDMQASIAQQARQAMHTYNTVKVIGHRGVLDFYQLMTAPISKIMDKWFESDVLKATIATDGVIGFAASPYQAGTGYVLLHHVLGGLDDKQGAWGYVFGGMGAVSTAIGRAAEAAGAELYTEQNVTEILVEEGKTRGVRVDGKEIHADTVLIGTTPEVAINLIPKDQLPAEYRRSMSQIDYTSPVTKINVAVKELPDFSCSPNVGKRPMPHHQTTVHLNCEDMHLLHTAYTHFVAGESSERPIIEMTIPSSVDRTIVDGDGHVILLFTQYTPFSPKSGDWDEVSRERYARRIFDQIDEYAPNFSKSIVGYEVLTPPDLQRIFGLTGGNIFHGSMSMDQLYWSRPVTGHANYSTPVSGLFLCGSGCHPGGGVTGAPGRLAALTVLGK